MIEGLQVPADFKTGVDEKHLEPDLDTLEPSQLIAAIDGHLSNMGECSSLRFVQRWQLVHLYRSRIHQIPRRPITYNKEQVMSEEPSGWAIGYAVFAATMLMLAGSFHLITGLAGIIDDAFYVVTPNYVFEFDITTWGWIHLIGGILVIIAGLSVLKGHMYGRIIGIVAASISAIANFAWLPYREFWGAVIIAVDIAIIWALTAHGRDIAKI